MNQIEMLRKAQLYIADEIKRVCEENDIKYHLDFGSLLGAVRHQGFIPWDDDMDIGMLKSEYEKFVSVAPRSLRSDFFLDNYQTNAKCPLTFSKVRLKNTKYIELKGNANSEHNEIFVDIFPFYDISDNHKIAKREGTMMGLTAQILLSKAGYKVWAGEGLVKRIKFVPVEILGKVISENRLRNFESTLYNRHDGAEFVCVHGGLMREYRNYRIPKRFFQEHIYVDFEEHSYAIPKEYDKYLTLIYGEYMVLPPENQRITHMIQDIELGDYSF